MSLQKKQMMNRTRTTRTKAVSTARAVMQRVAKVVPLTTAGDAGVPSRSVPAALVGAMLREQRRSLNLTLQEVADRAAITKGFLSEIERDKAAPSVATLMRLRDALSLSVESLFRSSLPRVVRSHERQVMAFGGEKILCSLVSARDAHRMSVIWADLEPGGCSGPDPHSIEADEEIIIIVSGSLDMTVDGGPIHRLRAGDSFTFDPRHPHRYENPSASQSTRAICIIAPPPK